MMYPFLTLSDETEIVHSELLEDNSVKVYIEKPDEVDCFHHMTCLLPSYEIKEVFGFEPKEVDKYMNLVHDTAHLILQFAKEGGFANASGL